MSDKEITLDENGFATEAGFTTVYNYNGETREFISSSVEYLPFGVGVPAHSCTDAPGSKKTALQSTATLIQLVGNMLQTIAAKRSIAPKQENQKKSPLRVITLKIQPLSPH